MSEDNKWDKKKKTNKQKNDGTIDGVVHAGNETVTN